MTTEVRLSEHTEIKELLEVLEKHGLTKEKSDVSSLVSYIENMENKLNEMTKDLHEMYGEVTKIRDSTLHAKCAQALSSAGEKIAQAQKMVTTFKNNFIISAKHALEQFKRKGKESLVTAVNAMKIPFALDALRNGFNKASETMARNAEKTDLFRNELHGVGFHLKNVGRALIGKPPKESEQMKSDKGILAKLKSFYEKASKMFSDMGKGTGGLSQRMKDNYEKQQSVKYDLKQLKAMHQNKAKYPLSKEIAR